MVVSVLGPLPAPCSSASSVVKQSLDNPLVSLINRANNPRLGIQERCIAICNIGYLKDDYAVEFLTTLIDCQDKTKHDLHMSAIRALGNNGNKKVIELLVDIIIEKIQKRDNSEMSNYDQTQYLESSSALHDLAINGLKEEVLTALSESTKRFHAFGVKTTLLIGTMANIDPTRAIKELAIKLSNSKRSDPGYAYVALRWIGSLLQNRDTNINYFLSAIEKFDRNVRDERAYKQQQLLKSQLKCLPADLIL